MAQIFIALLTFKMATSEGRSCNPDMPDRSCDFNKSLELYRFAAAVALLGCGGVYLLGGALCFGILKRGWLACPASVNSPSLHHANSCIPLQLQMRLLAVAGHARC